MVSVVNTNDDIGHYLYHSPVSAASALSKVMLFQQAFLFPIWSFMARGSQSQQRKPQSHDPLRLCFITSS